MRNVSMLANGRLVYCANQRENERHDWRSTTTTQIFLRPVNLGRDLHFFRTGFAEFRFSSVALTEKSGELSIR